MDVSHSGGWFYPPGVFRRGCEADEGYPGVKLLSNCRFAAKEILDVIDG